MAGSQGGAVALITGANSGIGKDVARQLALSGRYKAVLVASRNAAKGEAARRDLEQQTGLNVFRSFELNLSNADAVRSAVGRLPGTVDDLVMNAGGFGGEEPFTITRDGIAEIAASNVFGHAVLLDEVLKRDFLLRSAVFAGSEAARGVPQMGIKRPVIESGSAAEFRAVLDGSRFRRDKLGVNAAYAWTKLIGALWIGHMARAHPERRFVTMSPGGTAGTGAADVYPQPARFLVRHIVMPGIMPLLGMGHSLEAGAKRLVDAVTDERYRAGVFYASRSKTAGPIADQADQFSALANPAIQDAAAEALETFMNKGQRTVQAGFASSTVDHLQ